MGHRKCLFTRVDIERLYKSLAKLAEPEGRIVTAIEVSREGNLTGRVGKPDEPNSDHEASEVLQELTR